MLQFVSLFQLNLVGAGADVPARNVMQLVSKFAVPP
jgi:hypothetical protein